MAKRKQEHDGTCRTNDYGNFNFWVRLFRRVLDGEVTLERSAFMAGQGATLLVQRLTVNALCNTVIHDGSEYPPLGIVISEVGY